MHVEYFERHRFSERAIVKRLKLEFLSAVFPPERVPFFTFLSGGNVDLPVNVFAGDAAMRAGNRVNGLVAAESLAAVDACPCAIAQRSISHNGRVLRHRSKRSERRLNYERFYQGQPASPNKEGVPKASA